MLFKVPVAGIVPVLPFPSIVHVIAKAITTSSPETGRPAGDHFAVSDQFPLDVNVLVAACALFKQTSIINDTKTIADSFCQPFIEV